MAQHLAPPDEGLVTYDDRSPQTETCAKHVAAFLTWAAEPHLGLAFAALLCFVKGGVWSSVDH